MHLLDVKHPRLDFPTTFGCCCNLCKASDVLSASACDMQLAIFFKRICCSPQKTKKKKINRPRHVGYPMSTSTWAFLSLFFLFFFQFDHSQLNLFIFLYFLDFQLGNTIYFGLIFVDLSRSQTNVLIFIWFLVLLVSIFLIIQLNKKYFVWLGIELSILCWLYE